MEIPERVRRELIEYFSARPEVVRAILFGSRARDDADDRSDIDLAIEAPDATQRQWLDIWFHLKEELGTLLSVDIVRLEEAPADLADKILAQGEILYERRENSTKS